LKMKAAPGAADEGGESAVTPPIRLFRLRGGRAGRSA
jgi:hypothetical protein